MEIKQLKQRRQELKYYLSYHTSLLSIVGDKAIKTKKIRIEILFVVSYFITKYCALHIMMESNYIGMEK